MLRLLQAVRLTLPLAALSIFTTSCSTGTTQARFFNAVPDTQDYGNTGLDVNFNGTKEFTNVGFPSASASTYVTVPAGSVQIEGFETGGISTEVFDHTLRLSGGKQYTVVATGSAANGGNATLLTPVDANTAPPNGSVNFRVINASPSGPNGVQAAVDIYILPNPNPCSPGTNGCTPTMAALAYKDTSSYVTLPFSSAGTGWQIVVTVAGNPTPIINSTIGGFGGASVGAICTLVLTDQANVQKMSTAPIALQDLNAPGCTVN